ncbi:phosphoglycerate kinase [Candidatus Palauibacter polyketidifaciens]|uniref:phosphoglycerate kinase n=1 Tax=Candidatus Palauibacter polyketidifaciens TaxID=3056740 RepID=UPI00139EF4EC|nr:phosphoglycerate kinase [Candidatus Palauibacter polyketidifaciens]MDE2721559.1 phosphoglycerate kinase [Candidatus Palauibacter polyketidifaciens]MYE35709.1 phosphoglycerate kinase [Gemmatimonadales bacterium]
MTRTLRDLPAGLAGKRGLVRVDYNVPLDAGQVADATRIEASLPTLRWLLRRDVRPVLLSHLGRPGGQPNPALSLAPVASALAGLLDAEVLFSAPCDGEDALRASRELGTGQILLAENTRFLPGETANDDALAGRLARLGDFFVNDAFGTLHRAHASTTGVPALLSPSAAGLLVERELEALGALDRPRRPFIVAFGGAKIGDKIELMRRFTERADLILVGGAMANTFLRAQGIQTGSSLVEEEALDLARSILAAGGERIRLPADVMVLDRSGGKGDDVESVAVGAIEPGMAALDIGPESRASYAKALDGCAAFFWNGPMGLFEDPRFAAGTFAVAEAAAQATAAGAFTVIGGGDSAAAVRRAGLLDRVSHVCTGGGAALEYLSSGRLPGLDVLNERTRS